jgi:hypothetical protein
VNCHKNVDFYSFFCRFILDNILHLGYVAPLLTV